MKKQYDFTKGEKSKFYIPESEIELPIYLNERNGKFYSDLANSKNTSVSKLINNILTCDIEILSQAISS